MSLSRRPARSSVTALALLACLTLSGTAARAQEAEPVFGWTDRAPATPDLDEWSPDIQPAPYFETWDLWMWTDEGTFVMVQYLTASFGFGIERNASGRMIVVSPTGFNRDGVAGEGAWFGDRGWEWDSGDWNWEQEALDITFRDCHIRGDGETFEIAMRGRQRTAYLEATITPTEPMFTPGDGRLEFGWDHHRFYEQTTLPRFDFEGRLNVKPNRDAPDDWQPISGVGYAEHTLTNAFPFEVADAFQGFRALRDDGLSIVFDGLSTPPEYGSEQLGWARIALNGEPLFTSYDVAFVPTDVRAHESGAFVYRVPYGFEVRATSGADWMRVVVHTPELVSAESPFARVGAFLRTVLSAMMSPYDFELGVDYDAWIHIDGHTAFVSGRGWSSINFAQMN